MPEPIPDCVPGDRLVAARRAADHHVPVEQHFVLRIGRASAPCDGLQPHRGARAAAHPAPWNPKSEARDRDTG